MASMARRTSDQQDQWRLLYLLRVLVGDYTPQQAIDAPAFHTTAVVSSCWPRTWNPAGLLAAANSCGAQGHAVGR
jgi:gamma-glutamyltranspeptidase/glutathione hydrolase